MIAASSLEPCFATGLGKNRDCATHKKSDPFDKGEAVKLHEDNIKASLEIPQSDAGSPTHFLGIILQQVDKVVTVVTLLVKVMTNIGGATVQEENATEDCRRTNT